MNVTEVNREICRYLAQVAGLKRRCKLRGFSAEELVLRYGLACRPAPKPKGIKWGTARECFRNAALLALEDSKLTYVEGFAHSGILPVNHAWVMDRKGRSIDVTWKGREMNGCVGIPFKVDFLRQSLIETKYYGILTVECHRPYIYTLTEQEIQSAVYPRNGAKVPFECQDYLADIETFTKI